VFAPACASTTTIVVESHSKVPSDSGSSVGTSYAETSSRSTETPVRDATARSWSSPTQRSRPTRARRSEPRMRRRRAAQPRRRCATRRPLLPPRQRLLELRELAAQRLLHHADTLRIPLDHRLRHLLGLHPRDVRRQRRHLRVGLDFEYARPARGERLLPCVAHLVTVLAVDPAEAEQLRVLRVRDARDPLRA